ncbi:deoxyguanosinetriphosphate triphosphohydrolase [Jannaschia sp. LMIT008]|uniref:deoxyguanosinetriphosphate triphosphohydrolase n=1 Tax=Jannaschia maritima TaxID=3032585 RepID=UPI00281181FA|nr:deoxyguanosinetriphosphate triphosphohydrolase [Jannaschia sp. LMIT008]
MFPPRAPYACDPAASRGRLHPEPPSQHRSAFQRDRDRIVHCGAFRRLKHKTQVFVEHEGDHYRTRLTHSIEVAQVARTISKALGLEEELAESVALAHDLGHTPFGHTGEEALARRMAPFGGFDHNAQAIRVVTRLERHYADWDGLNLTWETLEGIAKHNGPVPAPHPHAIAEYDAVHDLALHTHAGAEAQVAALSDDIAYSHHDLHDGLRAGLFTDAELREMPLVGPCYAAADRDHPGIPSYRKRHEALRRYFGVLVEDVLANARGALAALDPAGPDDVRAAGHMVVRFSDPVWADLKVMRAFLFQRMYRAPRVVAMRARVTQVTDELFDFFLTNPEELPKHWRNEIATAEAEGEAALARFVCDYIAGMTDRFAIQSHARLLGGVPGLS